MKINTIIGMCIIFAILVTSVSAYPVKDAQLAQLLQGYNKAYSDDTFTATYLASSSILASSVVPGKESGRIYLNFSISGPGTYTVVAAMNPIGLSSYSNPENVSTTRNNIVSEVNMTSPGIASFTFDGSYFKCNASYGENGGIVQSTLDVDLRIYDQNNNIRYENTFTPSVTCDVYPVSLWCNEYQRNYNQTTGSEFVCNNEGVFSAYSSRPINLSSGNLNMTLGFELTESRVYRIGATISDGKGAFAYRETNTAGFTSVNFIFPADSLKDFNLTNERPVLTAITIDGQAIDDDEYVKYYNLYRPAQIMSTSSFAFTGIKLNSVSFDTTHQSGGKLSEMGVNLATSGSAATHDLELSLENIYGESIDSKKITSWTPGTAIWFNGTDIYDSKINGPYRIGFVRISQSGTEYVYELDKGQTADYAYTNFTQPPTPDVKVNDSDISGGIINTTLTIYNPTNSDAVGITVSLFNSAAQKIGEIIIDRINALSNTAKTFNVAGGVFAIVDFNNNVEEINESNNVATINTFIPLSLIANATPTSGNIPLNVAFTSLATGGNGTYTYRWDFNNDGTYDSTTQNPSFNYASAGSYVARINVTDSVGTTAQTTFAITSTTGPAAPTITSTPTNTATQGVQYSYTMTATDPNLDTLTYSVNDSRLIGSNPFTWTPSSSDYGVATVKFSVTDGTFAMNQTVNIAMLSNNFTLKLATLEFGTTTFINSTITVGSDVKNTTDIADFQNFTINSNTVYGLMHSSSGYTADTDTDYFDSRLSSCVAGQDCTLAGTYTTICLWQATSTAGIQIPVSNSWYCSVESGSLPKDWYRYVDGTDRYIRRFNYLVRI